MGALVGALVVLSPVPSAAVAAAATRFAGKTSQHAPITFTVSGGYLRDLRFTIYIKCPSRHIWRVAASKFPPIKVKHGVFAQKFFARDAKASATVRGTVSGRRVRGMVSDRTYEPKEHHFCAASARFDLAAQSRPSKPPAHSHGGPGTRPGSGSRPPRPRSRPDPGASTLPLYERLHGLRALGAGTTMPVANEWPAGHEKNPANRINLGFRT
jgi:hypothetical protein